MSIALIENPAAALVRRAQEAGIKMVEICDRSGVAKSTPSRWNGGKFEPKMKTIRRMEEALAEIIAEKAARPSAEG